MAEMGLFFESINGDRRYKVSELVAYLKPFFSDGVFPNPSTGLKVVENSSRDMFIILKRGDAWINGRMYRNLDDKKFRLDPADYASARIDRLVIGCDYKNRRITSYVKKGVPSSFPTPPEIVRNNTLYELSLAEIKIDPGTVGISQSGITDTRLNTDVCGIVTGLVDTVDTKNLYDQLERWKVEFIQIKESEIANWISTFQYNMNSWKTSRENDFNNWSNSQKQEFVNWFNQIKGQLNGDIAANLNNRVSNLEKRVEDLGNNLGVNTSASNVSINTIIGMESIHNVQRALEFLTREYSTLKQNYENLKNEISGYSTRLNRANSEIESQIGRKI